MPKQVTQKREIFNTQQPVKSAVKLHQIKFSRWQFLFSFFQKTQRPRSPKALRNSLLISKWVIGFIGSREEVKKGASSQQLIKIKKFEYRLARGPSPPLALITRSRPTRLPAILYVFHTSSAPLENLMRAVREKGAKSICRGSLRKNFWPPAGLETSRRSPEFGKFRVQDIRRNGINNTDFPGGSKFPEEFTYWIFFKGLFTDNWIQFGGICSRSNLPRMPYIHGADGFEARYLCFLAERQSGEKVFFGDRKKVRFRYFNITRGFMTQ